MGQGEALMVLIVLTVAAALAIGVIVLALLVRARQMHYWLPAYIAGTLKRAAGSPDGTTVYVCVADHFEPFGGGAGEEAAARVVDRWVTELPRIAARHRDSLGQAPKHTFFYPLEDYHAVTLDRLAAVSKAGFGDVEVHYHHDGDNAESLAAALTNFKQTLHSRHGLLRTEGPEREVVYAFIHGNWALDNSRPDGRWCGVNDELGVLVRTGCRVDFTMPSAPSDTQTRKINSIYFAKGRPGKSKSHDSGRDAAPGIWSRAGELLLVQGPLGLNWRFRKAGILPRIENGEISADALPTADRVRLWARLAPRLGSRGEHVFIKLHTHGAPEPTMTALLEHGLDAMWTALEAEFRDRPGTKLRYVTAWEMYRIIRDICTGPAAGGPAAIP